MTTNTTTIRVTREIPGEYVRAGELYTVEIDGRGFFYLRNVARGTGTPMSGRAYGRALADRSIVPVQQS